MFRRAILDKLPECIFEDFEITREKRGQFQKFQKSREWFIPKIEPNQQTLCNETNSF